MCKAILKVAIIVVVTLVLAGAGAAYAQQGKMQIPPKPPEGYVVLHEDFVVYFIDEPAASFRLALERLSKGEAKPAAEAIRKGAAFVAMEASHATPEHAATLMSEVEALDKLAGDVQNRTVKSVPELEKRFAMTHMILAKHHHAQAKLAQEQNKPAMVAHHMKAAAAHIEHQADSAKVKAEATLSKAAKDCKDLSEKIEAGGAWTADEVGKSLESLGTEIEKLGKTEEAKK